MKEKIKPFTYAFASFQEREEVRVSMEDFNTEISGSSCSIPSERPDIRNWFSSYKYESFVLDACENFGGISSDERESNKDELVIGGDINREKEENFEVSGEIRKVDEHGNLNSSQVQDPLHSLSILSEPPDIRNWFSSYVATSDCFKSYISSGSGCEKDELVIGESFKDEVNNSGQSQETNNSCKKGTSEQTCSAELVKCSSSSLEDRRNESHSLYSEPPDIGNWFPDYVYESPALDTSDDFRVTLSMERESNEDKFAVEDSKRKKQENFKTTTKTRYRNEVVVGKVYSNEFGKCNSSPRHDEQENKPNCEDLHWTGGRENHSWQGDLCFEKILDPSLETKQMQSGCSNSNESFEGDSISKLEEADSQWLHISRSPDKNGKKSLKKLIDRRVSIGTKAQTDKVSLASHGQSQRKPTHGSNANDKENEGKDIAENGFITTRKHKFIRTNDENSVRVPGEILLQCSRNKSSNTAGNEKDGVVKRMVLAETSNVNANSKQCEAKAIEITGKWRCPRKSKPPRGPPLKQLRLEQWIHRV